MATRNQLAPARGYGAAAFAGIRFVPGASPTIDERWGIASLTRNGAGDYTIALLGKPKGFICAVNLIENDTANFHETRVIARSDSAGTCQVRHRHVAYAALAEPTASDTADAIEVLFFERTE